MVMDMAVEIWASSCDDIYYPLNEDCDDTDPAVSPDAYEVCDGIDNDCDGNADAAGMCPCFFDTNNGSNYLFCNYNRTGLSPKESVRKWGITW